MILQESRKMHHTGISSSFASCLSSATIMLPAVPATTNTPDTGHKDNFFTASLGSSEYGSKKPTYKTDKVSKQHSNNARV